MTHTLELLSPAKLNLFLHINGRRADGYHNLQTLFQLLDYGDTLSFTRRTDTHISLSPPIAGVSFECNLIARAALLLQAHTGARQGADIRLTKRLPMGGGIGGGSSNAATTLVALNHLWRCGLSRPELQHLGLQLGADVPVFVFAQTAWAEGLGESLAAIEMPQNWFLVVQPDCQVSTQHIFSHKDLTRDSPAITVAAFLELGGNNACQDLVRALYPPVNEALTWFAEHGYHAQLTGTGACVFTQLATAEAAQQLRAQLPKHMQSFVAQGVNHSPLYGLVDD